MNAASVLAELDQLIARRSILQHPFYQAWTEGRLTRADLATYARVYYPHVAAFPGYLERTLATTDDAEIRAELSENLREELGEPKAHPELWLDFARGMGAVTEAVRTASPIAETGSAVATFERLASQSTAAGLAALYAYESQQPEVASTKATGLTERYGCEDAATLAYFHVHTEADQRHRDGERHSLERCLDAGATREEILGAAGEALDAYWHLLDGVCREAGIRCEN